jgi:hypothetical protein
MQHASTLILTGHLQEYPLSDVFGILRHQRETGRLSIDYPDGPGVFLFKDGELVDAQVGILEGVQAVWWAKSLPESPFNFNPLIEPPAQSISIHEQKIVPRILGCLEDEVIQNAEARSETPVTDIRGEREATTDAPRFIKKVPPEEIAPVVSVPTTSDSDRTNHRNRIQVSVGPLLLFVAIVSTVALTGVFGRKPAPAPAPVEQQKTNRQEGGAIAPPLSEDVIGPSGYSEVTHGDSQNISAVPARENIRQSPHIPAPKKSGAEVAILPRSSPSAPPNKKSVEPSNVNKLATSDDSTITVITQVENGRVTEAYVANRRPGMEAFEASALRAARQRRFSPGTKGSEKVLIKVGKR